MSDPIHYINTDLELVALVDLTPLANYLTAKGFFQLRLDEYDSQWYAAFETHEQYESAEPNITAFLEVIEALRDVPAQLWASCSSRTFDIGFESGEQPFSISNRISTGTLARIAGVGAAIAITLYKVYDGDSSED